MPTNLRQVTYIKREKLRNILKEALIDIDCFLKEVYTKTVRGWINYIEDGMQFCSKYYKKFPQTIDELLSMPINEKYITLSKENWVISMSTSGTTGSPKIVYYGPKNTKIYVKALLTMLDFSETLKIISSPNTFIVSTGEGFTTYTTGEILKTLIQMLGAGNVTHIPVDKVENYMFRENINVIQTVTSFLPIVVKILSKKGVLNDKVVCGVSGSRLDESIVALIKKYIPKPYVFQVWGSTEGGYISGGKATQKDFKMMTYLPIMTLLTGRPIYFEDNGKMSYGNLLPFWKFPENVPIQVLFTTLYGDNHLMINYKIGDIIYVKRHGGALMIYNVGKEMYLVRKSISLPDGKRITGYTGQLIRVGSLPVTTADLEDVLSKFGRFFVTFISKSGGKIEMTVYIDQEVDKDTIIEELSKKQNLVPLVKFLDVGVVDIKIKEDRKFIETLYDKEVMKQWKLPKVIVLA